MKEKGWERGKGEQRGDEYVARGRWGLAEGNLYFELVKECLLWEIYSILPSIKPKK